jgi:thiol-disulfide isomerase/thioredoxin
MVNEKYYYSNGIDTTFTPFEVWVVRQDSDALRKAYVWIDNNYRPYNTIYENGKYYLAIPPKKTTVIYENYSDPFISEADWIDAFLQPEKFSALLSDSLNKTIISDSLLNGKKEIKLELILPADKEGTIVSFTYLINAETKVPIWTVMHKKAKDFDYYDELSFSNYEFNTLDLNALKKKQAELFEANPLEKEANSDLSLKEQMLQVGDKAPLFDGNFYSTQDTFYLADLIGKKVIILDFWYTHCPPCVKAIPALSDFQEANKDKDLVILGLNSVDNQAKSLDNLNTFLSKRQLSYKVVMTQPAVDLMYKIKGYPSMYIIDKKGNVAFVETGYDETKFEELKKNVLELLSK